MNISTKQKHGKLLKNASLQSLHSELRCHVACPISTELSKSQPQFSAPKRFWIKQLVGWEVLLEEKHGHQVQVGLLKQKHALCLEIMVKHGCHLQS